MAHARRVHAERNAVRVVVTTPTGPGVRRHSVGAEAATTVPTDQEQQASSAHPSVQSEGRTATASSSHARMELVNTQVTLPMTHELVCYHPADAGYDAWLARITHLVTAVGEAPTPSRSLRSSIPR
ncbi:hypothetical protein D1007_42341 [Hordeum vulgare]|nr:hypothetical protein D1007_42341 [Hordeum vulgare]